jgi:hypothetical protein
MNGLSETRVDRFERSAQALLALHSDGFTLLRNKDYVVLERRLTKSDSNKNAVSVIREGFSFMVPDWSDETEAVELGLKPERSKRFKRLILAHLDESQITQHAEFLTKLIIKAKIESERLQASGKAN